MGKRHDVSKVSEFGLEKGKDFRIGPPKISHFAKLEWQKTMLEGKRRLNFFSKLSLLFAKKPSFLSVQLGMLHLLSADNVYIGIKSKDGALRGYKVKMQHVQ